MCDECQLDSLIDCSDEAKAQRDADIAALRALRMSLVTNVSDRGRSVSYDRRELGPMLDELLAEKYYCLYGTLPPAPAGRRLVGPPLIWKRL